jgi:hypothetical protein
LSQGKKTSRATTPARTTAISSVLLISIAAQNSERLERGLSGNVDCRI